SYLSGLSSPSLLSIGPFWQFVLDECAPFHPLVPAFVPKSSLEQMTRRQQALSPWTATCPVSRRHSSTHTRPLCTKEKTKKRRNFAQPYAPIQEAQINRDSHKRIQQTESKARAP